MYKSRVQPYDNIWLLFWETPFLYIVFRKGERGSWKEKVLIVRADADSSNSFEFSNLRCMELGDWVKIIQRCRIIEIRIEHRFFNYSTIFCSIFLNVRGAWRRVKKYIEFTAVWIISMMASYSRKILLDGTGFVGNLFERAKIFLAFKFVSPSFLPLRI